LPSFLSFANAPRLRLKATNARTAEYFINFIEFTPY
jgi:hypothetical protein